MNEKRWQLKNPNGKTEIEYDGKCLTFERWAEITGVTVATIQGRFYRGLPVEDIFYKGRLPRPKED